MINKVILMGRLTADPELRQTPSGVSVCRFTVAVNRPYADKQTGERQADFIGVQAWRNTADFIVRYFHKGSMIIVEGSLRNNDYTDQNGVKHYSYNVLAENVTFGESKSAGGNQANTYPQNNSAQTPPQNAQKPPQRAVQTTLDNFASNMHTSDLSEYEILSDGDIPF